TGVQTCALPICGVVVAAGLRDGFRVRPDRLGVAGHHDLAFAGDALVAARGVVNAADLVVGLALGVLAGDRLGVAGYHVVAPAGEDLIVARVVALAAVGVIVRLRLGDGVIA